MKIVWTKTAKLSYQAEIDFILSKWHLKEAKRFVKLVDDVLVQLKKFPLLGKDSKNNRRYIVISKQTTIIYRLLDGEILELLLFWNNKQNPKDLEEAIIQQKINKRN